jgi:hypothetical protein
VCCAGTGQSADLKQVQQAQQALQAARQQIPHVLQVPQVSVPQSPAWVFWHGPVRHVALPTMSTDARRIEYRLFPAQLVTTVTRTRAATRVSMGRPARHQPFSLVWERSADICLTWEYGISGSVSFCLVLMLL